MHIKSYMCILIFFVISMQKYSISQKYASDYQSGRLCNKCKCTKIPDNNLVQHYILDCISRNLEHIFPVWPQEFGTNHSGSEIVASFSGNMISLLQQIPETYSFLTFSCRSCGIKSIEPGIFIDATNIVNLDLSWNDFTREILHADIFRGRYNNREYEPISLIDLNLSNNKLKSLNSKLFEHTPYLQILDLSFNQFDLIDSTTEYAISSITTLEQLDLSYNQISSLPQDIFKSLKKLRVLFLQGNHLKTIPESLKYLSASLETLSISNNPIESIDAKSFYEMKFLRNLNISYLTKLKSIERFSFKHLRALEVFSCSQNPQLTIFDISDLISLHKLREINLSNNNIENFILDVDIESNTTLQSTYLQKISLYGNPFNCSCSLIKVFKLLNIMNMFEYSNKPSRCFSPYSLAGSIVTKLNENVMCTTKDFQRAINEEPLSLRPRTIALYIVSISSIIVIGILAGFGCNALQKKLKNKYILKNSLEVKYTAIRNSVISNATH